MRRKSNVWYPVEMKLLSYSITGKILIQGNFDACRSSERSESERQGRWGAVCFICRDAVCFGARVSIDVALNQIMSCYMT